MEEDNQFENVVQKQHPFYQLLSISLKRCQGIFEIKQNDHLSNLEAAFPLKMYCRQNIDAKYATFIYFFTLPIEPNQYINITRDLLLQKTFEAYIDQFKIYKDLQVPNTEVLFLSYKKILIVMPRYFIYVRYTFQFQGDWWIIAASDPKAEIIKQKTKGEIVLTVTRVKKVEGGCEISIFSETDMKMNLKFQTAKNKGFSELKKYLEKVYAHAKTISHQ